MCWLLSRLITFRSPPNNSCHGLLRAFLVEKYCGGFFLLLVVVFHSLLLPLELVLPSPLLGNHAKEGFGGRIWSGIMMWLNGCWQGAARSMRQGWEGKCEMGSLKRLTSTPKQAGGDPGWRTLRMELGSGQGPAGEGGCHRGSVLTVMPSERLWGGLGHMRLWGCAGNLLSAPGTC